MTVNIKWTTFVNRYGLEQLVVVPTRVTEKSATLIYRVYCTNTVSVKDVSVPRIALSDHYPVSIAVSSMRSGHIPFREKINDNPSTNTHILTQLK